MEDFVDFFKSKSLSKGEEKKQEKAGLDMEFIQMKAGFEEPLDAVKDYM